MNKAFGIILVTLAIGMFVLGEVLVISRQKCKISFTNIDDEFSVEISKGGYVKKPENPEKDGYAFLGWYQNDEKYNFNSKVNEDITLVAKWGEPDEKIEEPVNNSLSASLWTLIKDKFLKK